MNKEHQPLLNLLFLLYVSDVRPQLLCTVVTSKAAFRYHHPWCGMKNTFSVSVYFREYTFPIFLISSYMAVEEADFLCILLKFITVCWTEIKEHERHTALFWDVNTIIFCSLFYNAFLVTV
jgi:hypothetical protein